MKKMYFLMFLLIPISVIAQSTDNLKEDYEYNRDLGYKYYDNNEYSTVVYYLTKSINIYEKNKGNNNKSTYWFIISTCFDITEAYYCRSMAKLKLEDRVGSVSDLRKCLYIINTFGGTEKAYGPSIKCRTLNQLALMLIGINKYVEAEKYLIEAIKLYPDYCQLYMTRSTLKFYRKNKKGACEDLSKAGELGCENAYKMISQYCNDNYFKK